jgi:hypothetical protein
MEKGLSNKKIIILLIVIAVYSVLCLTKHQHQRLTADSMLYFSIAQKYLAGDFQNAINGYWGPLLSWLLIPFLYFGVSHVFTINVVDAIFGVLLIIGVWIISYRFEITEKIRSIIIISLLPIALKFSLVHPADFLLVCILVFYLAIVFKSDYPKKISSGIFSGILGSLAYLTKAYAFPFFIAHFFVINIMHYFSNFTKEGKQKVLKNAIAGFVLFFLISGAWIMIISNKYGHFTFSTMRDTNFNAPGPEAMGGGLEFGVPVFYEGFFDPPNKTAFVVWEDPSYIRGQKWSAWQSWNHFKHFIRLILKNVSDGLKIFETFSTLSFAIILVCLLLLLEKPRKEFLHQGNLLYPLFTIALFSGGYLLFHLEERYLWLVNVLLLLMGGYILTILFQRRYFEHNSRKSVLIIFFVISFIFSPVKFVIQVSRGGMDSDMYHVSTDLKQYNIKGNIASNREYIPVHDAWHKTFRLSYWLDSRYYGQAREGISDQELVSELKKYNIDYYFLWGEGTAVPQFLTRYKEITANNIPGLKIYSLRAPLIPSGSAGNRE